MEDRSFELLWGPRRRGSPRTGARPERRADRGAAIALADAEGLGALSMRRLARDLGVAPMALYRYVPGKTELLDVMVDAVIGEQAAAEEGGWRSGWRQSARASRALHERHPWLAPATLGATAAGAERGRRLRAAARRGVARAACARPRPWPPSG